MAGDVRNIKLGSAWVAVLTHGGKFRVLGFSQDGPNLAYSATTEGVDVDQLTMSILNRITDEEVSFTFPAVEITTENLTLAFPAASVSGKRVTVYPAGSVNIADKIAAILIHPVYKGAPAGSEIDLSDPSYDSSEDILLFGTPSSEFDITFARDGIWKVTLGFDGVASAIGALLDWGDPFLQDLTFTPTDMTGAIGAEVTQTLTASGGTAPYTFSVAPFPGWNVDGDELKFTSDTPGEYKTLVYAMDGERKYSPALITATIS